MERLVTTPLSRSWNKPIVDYLSWFLRQVNYYNELALFDTDRLTPTTVRTMLERNVQAAPPLAAVRDRELFEIARGGAPLNPSQCVALLKSAASTMDIKKSRLCQANVHEQSSDDTEPAEETSTDDMDDALAELEACTSCQRVPGSSMNKETWQSLEKATHLAWDMISPNDKSKILNYAMERAERTRQAAAMHQRSANVANMSLLDSAGIKSDLVCA